MRLFGIEIKKAGPRNLQSVDDGRGWFSWPVGGSMPEWAFQRDVECLSPDKLTRNGAVFACMTLIASDISKLRIGLFAETNKVWQEVISPAYSKLLRKPNHFQTRQQLVECWALSKQFRGNAYILKGRDGSTRVSNLYVLDPDRVQVLVAATTGAVYYRLQADDLAGVPDGEVVVPASEIIHDRFNCLFHPLMGLSPLYSCALAGTLGVTIQEQATQFFGNRSQPGGLLTSPQVIGDDLAKKYKDRWETNFSGANRGKTAVLGNGLDYKVISESAVASDLVAQMKLTGEMVCAAFHVPAYKVGIGATPTYQNAEILNQIYYDSCLQVQIEAIESLLDDALGLEDVDGRTLRTQFDLEGLLRMDSSTMSKNLSEQAKSGFLSPNEGRAKLGRAPVKGGEAPLSQRQNWPLDVLAEREPPTAGGAAMPPAPAAPPTEDDDEEPQQAAKGLSDYLVRELDYA